MALATAKRAEIFTSNIDKHCAFCGSIENYAHLFFLCDLPQQVWANFNTPLSTHLINPDLDGVQHIIPHLFSTNPTEENLTQTLLLLWHIWKARNDHRFQRIYGVTILTGAAALCWAIWRCRNDIIFDNVIKNSSFIQAILKGTYWLRFWSILQRGEKTMELYMKTSTSLEMIAL
jgi:hypothetical protein